jgi:biopolymer transport protein ExbB
MKRSVILLAAAICLYGGEATSLDQLLEQVKSAKEQSARLNREREALFTEAASRQEALVAETKRLLEAENRRSEELKKTIDANEKSIAGLAETLRLRSAGLGEIFGVVRQTSGDRIAMAKSSLVAAEFQELDAIVFRLGEAKELPDAGELRSLWINLQSHLTQSGKVARFDADVIYPDGTTKREAVLRIGEFTATSGENFLEYSFDEKAFIVLPRQPEGRYTDLAESFGESHEPYARAVVDPTRGAMLGMMMERPTLNERIGQGGVVGYIIILIGTLGILFAFYRLYVLMKTERVIAAQLADVTRPRSDNPLGRVLEAYAANKTMATEDIEIKLDEAILKETPALTHGHVLIKLLAAIAPLLGLLGTVTGMIATFQAITLFGTGDPKLMAGGISQALVTTVLGLVAAMPLLFLHTVLNAKGRGVIQILSEQAAGLMAHSLEVRR